MKVKFGSVELSGYPWRHHSGKTYFRFDWFDGRRKRHITRASEAKAKKAAYEKAKELHRQTKDLNALPDHQQRAIYRLLDVDPSLHVIDEFLLWRARERPETLIEDVIDAFMESVALNKGQSAQNEKTLKVHAGALLKAFPGRSMSSISTAELNAHIGRNPKHSPRTRANCRGALIRIWNWCQANGHIPQGEKTAAALTMAPIVARKTPETYSPDELAEMFLYVGSRYLPWLAACAFGGFRTDEIYPLAGGTKSPLDWSDFKWDRDVVVVRPETGKTGRRVVPILPALRRWLEPVKKPSGPVGEGVAPSMKPGRGKLPKTVLLGDLVGGWRPNALRHSWISYRAALVGIGQTSMEAGNSESEAKRSYNDAKSQAEAAAWFSLKPENLGEPAPKSLKKR